MEIDVAAPCNVMRGSGMTCHWIRPHPAMWHVALESRHWIRQVAAPCSVAGGSGMTCHWIRPNTNVRHIGILHLVSISTTSPQSTCHSAPVSDILSKSDHPQQKKMTSYRFSRWRISAILHFRVPVMGSLKIHVLHPAMWHVTLESWQWIHHVAAPCNVMRGSGMTCHSIRPHPAMWHVALE